LTGHFKLNEPRFYGVDEPELDGLLKRVLKPGDWAIDGGANCGMFTLRMARLVEHTGHILAFEPGENNLALLEENMRAGDAPQVEIIPKPLWSKPEKVRLYMHSDGSKNALSSGNGAMGSAEIEAVTLDAYASKRMYQALKLLKLDIEGCEHEALKGAEHILEHCPYVVVEANLEALPKFGSSIEALCGFMRERKFDTFILHPTDRLPTYVPPGVEIIPYNGALNVMKLNFNLLFTTMPRLVEAWPKAVCG
jgi:FkbM family methyltransferase